MSSTYRLLCLSHDPAIVEGDYSSSADAEQALAEGIEGHSRCDMLVGRFSYPLVEVGCPSSGDQPAKLRCYHGATVWADAGWLLLLASAYQSTDENVTGTVERLRLHCWPWERLRRLREELGFAAQRG
ncbi:hypothetical protein ACIQ6R_13280 [Streptomyces sp. NPDC096048]|uniref:hypothetical protein n=1 Tax=Streptomyces sp. NPDC096048 TaxID=3366072 RepID=UPI00382AFD3C